MTSLLLDVKIKDFSIFLFSVSPPLKLGVQIKRKHVYIKYPKLFLSTGEKKVLN